LEWTIEKTFASMVSGQPRLFWGLCRYLKFSFEIVPQYLLEQSNLRQRQQEQHQRFHRHQHLGLLRKTQLLFRNKINQDMYNYLLKGMG
jgi:hypothetical protein